MLFRYSLYHNSSCSDTTGLHVHYLREVSTLCPFHCWLWWCSGQTCVFWLTEHLHCQLLFLIQLQLPDITHSSFSCKRRETRSGRGPNDRQVWHTGRGRHSVQRKSCFSTTFSLYHRSHMAQLGTEPGPSH
jgi:hypothetical protein